MPVAYSDYVLSEIGKVVKLENWENIFKEIVEMVSLFMSDSSKFVVDDVSVDVDITSIADSLISFIKTNNGRLVVRSHNERLAAYIEKPYTDGAHYTLLEIDSTLYRYELPISNNTFGFCSKIEDLVLQKTMLNNLVTIQLRLEDCTIFVTISGVIVALENYAPTEHTSEVHTGTVVGFNVWENYYSDTSNTAMASANMYDNPFIEITMSSGGTNLEKVVTLNYGSSRYTNK